MFRVNFSLLQGRLWPELWRHLQDSVHRHPTCSSLNKVILSPPDTFADVTAVSASPVPSWWLLPPSSLSSKEPSSILGLSGPRALPTVHSNPMSPLHNHSLLSFQTVASGGQGCVCLNAWPFLGFVPWMKRTEFILLLVHYLVTSEELSFLFC